MSRINDALKQARQAAPPGVPQPLPQSGIPLRREEKSSLWSGLLLTGLILFALAGLSWFGWSATHHKAVETTVVQAPASQPLPIAPPPPVAATVTPVAVVAPVAVVPPTNPPVVPATPPLPVVQGIFYSPTDPSAIVSGKTVRPGNRLGNYMVKAIDQISVTLVDSNKKEIKLSIGH